MKPSRYHRNRQPYNWLVYHNLDKSLEKHSKYYKGILVDLGCGEAPYKEYFLQYADKYVGVDWSNTLHNFKADIVSDLNEKIELEDDYADTVVSISTIEHLREPENFLKEANRILKQNGYFILQVPWQWRVHEAPYDFFRYTPYGLTYLFEKAGFNVLEINAVGGFFAMMFLKTNYFTLRFIRGPKFLKTIVKTLLIPFWTINQIAAMILDGIDKEKFKLIEAPGYFVVAQKEKQCR